MRGGERARLQEALGLGAADVDHVERERVAGGLGACERCALGPLAQRLERGCIDAASLRGLLGRSARWWWVCGVRGSLLTGLRDARVGARLRWFVLMIDVG